MDIFSVPVATTPPPAQIPCRDDHPLPRLGVDEGTRQACEPVQTNKFYANLLLGEQDCPAYVTPYAVSWTKGRSPSCGWGLTVSHATADQRVFGPPACRHGAASAGYYFSPPIVQNVVLDAAELGAGTALTLEKPTDLSVTVALRAGAGRAPAVRFPLVQGQGFVTAVYDGATPVVRSAMAIVDLACTGEPKPGVRRFVLRMNDGAAWLLYARHRPGTRPLALRRTHASTVVGSTSVFWGSVQVARLVDDGSSQAVFDRASGVFAAGVRLSGDASGRYTLSFQKTDAAGGGGGSGDGGFLARSPLVMFALPHHCASFDERTRGGLTAVAMQTTVKGVAHAVLGDAWTLVEPALPQNMGFLPWDPKTRQPAPPLAPAVQQLAREVARQELSQDVDAQTNLDSMYFSGKGLAKFATIVLCVHDMLDDRALAAKGLGQLQAAFGRFAENRQQHPLVYDRAWGGVVSSAAYTTGDLLVDFGNAGYNDHHFHYGYFVYAAAVIDHLDPGWLAAHAAYVDLLVRDYANPSRRDPFFPVFRSFDWYHGHSWAHGLFASMDGKDQESSSEDIMAAYALKMWGAVRGDAALEARGNLMLAVLARALPLYYYYGDDNTTQPPAFRANRVAGILFENKIDHTTYFGASPEYIHGIHMIPLLPCSPYCRPLPFVAAEWADVFSGGRVDDVPGGWRGILYGNLATLDPAAAYAFFSSPGFDPGTLDGGASRTWYLCYSGALLGCHEHE